MSAWLMVAIGSAQEAVLQPDVGFITTARAGVLGSAAFPVAPDLAIEVISPSERIGRINKKIRAYFGAGTRLVWLVYVESRSIEVYSSADQFTLIAEKDTIDGGGVLPGFSVSGKELFQVLNLDTRPEDTTPD